MAKRGARKSSEESKAGWFRKVFTERPDWLEGKSNKEVRDRWVQEHPPHKSMPADVQNAMGNVKSLMRRGLRNEGSGQGARRASMSQTMESPKFRGLPALEVSIDESIILASNLDRYANGCWAKKIRGKLHYFGRWDDPDGALAK